MNSIIYDPATGEILRCVRLPEGHVVPQAGPGEASISGWATSSDAYVSGGTLVQYTPAEAALKKMRPDYPSSWDNATRSWIDLRSPEQAISDQWALVRAKRNAILSETDWIITRSLESGVQPAQEWVSYRQALRDITEQDDPFGLVWPTQPG